jgi:hypothetical protein
MKTPFKTRNFVLQFVVVCASALLLLTCESKMSSPAEKSLVGSVKDTRIPKDTAQKEMAAWDDIRKELEKDLRTSPDSALKYVVVKGFQIPPDEFQNMLSSLGPNPQVWAMLAIQRDEKTGKPYLGLIFQGKGQKTPESGNDYEYFDFTDPCPKSCPE